MIVLRIHFAFSSFSKGRVLRVSPNIGFDEILALIGSICLVTRLDSPDTIHDSIFLLRDIITDKYSTVVSFLVASVSLMASLASTLAQTLPVPKYSTEHEQIPNHSRSKGPRILSAADLSDNQIVLKVCQILCNFELFGHGNLTSLQQHGPPKYPSRSGWRPRSAEDYGDGGAFPEIPVAQYPLDMGRKGSAASSNSLAVQLDVEGKVKYDSIARQGHSDNRIVHASFKDLIPLRQRADVGDISLDRPSEDEVAKQTEKTKDALAKLVSGAVAAQKPKNVQGLKRNEPTYVRYTPANQMGDTSRKNDRIMKIVQRQQDPMEPPKFKHKKIPRGPPSPPPPVMHSPPRKLTAEDQEAWKIPPPISNWKNPKGYTVPLDKRLAADGRGLQDVTINDKFAQFNEALFTADRHAREEVKQRAAMQQKLAEKERMQKEEELRALAQQARQEKSMATRRTSRARSYSGSSASSYSRSDSEDEEATRERERMRRERRAEHEKQLRQSRMGAERRIQMMARDQNRDISEKVALGLAKPTKTTETMYDSRLFNQTSGFDTGFNEDQAYDKPLFAAQDAISSIYRPQTTVDDDDEDTGTKEYDKIAKSNRFEVLGKAKEGFKGASEGAKREGPVQFEKDVTSVSDDPFRIDEMIREVTGNAGHGQQDGPQDGERASKRARLDNDS